MIRSDAVVTSSGLYILPRHCRVLGMCRFTYFSHLLRVRE
jgi:hypothetical protein